MVNVYKTEGAGSRDEGILPNRECPHLHNYLTGIARNITDTTIVLTNDSSAFDILHPLTVAGESPTDEPEVQG